MSKSPREVLSEEYSKKLNNFTLWPLKFAAYLRFETKDGRFIKKTPSTVIRSVFMLILGNVLAACILYENTYLKKRLLITETITVVYITAVQNVTLLNITFFNRNSGLIILNTCIEIDVILGIKETKFMRDVAAMSFVTFSCLIALCQIGVTTILYESHLVSIAGHVIGTTYFIMVFLIFFDACFLVAFYTFLSLRVHYINIALIKLANINPDYFANQFFFDGILWRKVYDKLVTFHKRAENSQFIQVYDIIFGQLRRLERCFRFTIFIAMTSLIVGTFLGVQTILMHKQLPNFGILRTISIIGWVVLGWIYLLSLAQHTDIFYRQVEKTKLICTYIQLKPVMPAKVLTLTKDLLHMLEVHESRVSIYNMYYFNTSIILQIVATIFMYVTVQLQISVSSNRPNDEILTNVTDNSQKAIFFF